MKRLKRFVCFLIGHKYDEQAYYYGYPYCERCSKEFDKNGCEMANFEAYGCLAPAFIFKVWFKHKFHKGYGWEFLPRCDTCGKVSFKRYCSEECKENWIPF